ncbi:MAG: hypothetical protein ACRDRG_00665 [Pseudonocardiaceae bacterium]
MLADQRTLIMEGWPLGVRAVGVDGPAEQARTPVEAMFPSPEISGLAGELTRRR